MQDSDFEKTRILSTPPRNRVSSPPDAAADPGQTIIIKPSARAAAAAAALAEARHKRTGEHDAGEFRFSGEIDFDVTATEPTSAKPTHRRRRGPLLLVAVIVALMLVAALLWWGYLDAAGAVPVR
jgi:hypothetical protein